MPTSTHEDTEIEEICDQLNDLIEEEIRNENLFLIGETEEEKDGKEVERYNRGERLVEFCQEKKIEKSTEFGNYERSSARECKERK